MALPDARGTRDILEKWILASGMPLCCDLHNSNGAYLRDAQSGKDYLDLFSFFASRPLSFNHPSLTDPAFVERLGKISLHKPSNCDVYTPEYAAFTDIFAAVALGGAFAHVFFIEGGSPAVENALKTAIDWKHLKNIEAGRGDGLGSQTIHFSQCFHGRTGYCLSLTDSPDPRKTRYFPKFSWPRVSNPKLNFPIDDAEVQRVAEAEAASLAEIERAFDDNPNDIAAILIEPIQGEGGDNYFRPEFFAALREVCDRREALLIFDEVQTGLGGTGAWWDWQNLGVKPDVMVFGKKTQVCGIAATSRVDEVEGVFRTPSRISSTFEGNLTDMVRAHKVIEIIEEEGLIDHAKDMGGYLHKLLHELGETAPEMSNIRGRGLFAAFDLPSGADRDAVVDACFKEQLIILPCGERSVRMRPALDISADDLARGAAQLEVGICNAFGRKRERW